MPAPAHARWSRFVATVSMALSLPLFTAMAQGTTAIIEGRITDATSTRPLENVQVTIDGTALGAMTNAQGAYRITGVPVPAGSATVTLRVRAIGYTRETRVVPVSAGQTSKRDRSEERRVGKECA